MNVLSIVATFVAIMLIITGFENNTEGPAWLGFLVLVFVIATRLFMAFENYLVAKIRDW